MEKNPNKKFHIAIVEDNPQMRLLLSDFLQSQGYTVSCYVSAFETLRALEERRGPEAKTQFDTIVCDIVLPGLDGIELLKQVKQKNPDLPMVFITAFGTPQGAQEAMQLGATAYLTKPFKLATLHSAIQKNLGKKQP